MTRYYVTVPEVHDIVYCVQADDKDGAIRAVRSGEYSPQSSDFESEFSEDLWIIEEDLSETMHKYPAGCKEKKEHE